MDYYYCNICLNIKKSVIDIFNKYEQKCLNNEAGGILLGTIYPEYITIEKATTPSKLDQFDRLFYIRSKISAQRKINKNWKKSNGILIYLGEWHTHTSNKPAPSDQDKRMIYDALKYSKMEIDFLFLIIVGRKKSLWVGIQTQNYLIQLNQSKRNILI